jgi:DNA-binding transcriptional ArsR family regulator
MPGGRDLAWIGRILASDARSAMLDHLMDGADHAVTELAEHARVAPSTATAHVAALVEAGLVTVHALGRQRRVRLAGAKVARALEGLGAIATAPGNVSSLKESTSRRQLEAARTCYDHVAGRLGVAIADGLVDREALISSDGAFALTAMADVTLGAMGIDMENVRRAKRAVAAACLDWTERRPHVGGALGSSLCRMLLDTGAIRKRRGSRAVVLTDEGADFLRYHLGIALPEQRSS